MPVVTSPDASDDFRPNADELLAHNRRHVADFDDHDLQVAPRRRLAVVACMDSRMDMFELLGLAHGEAHIIRNAGGVITDDVIRSLVVSQLLLDTREIVLVHHTDCGLQVMDDTTFRSRLEQEFGMLPSWALDAFTDPYVDVRQSLLRIHMSPFIRHKNHVRGFVYRVDNGQLDEVTLEPG